MSRERESELAQHLSHLFVRPSIEVVKPRSLLIKLSPRTQGPKNYSGPRVLTSYFYFYVRFRAATVRGPYFLLLLLHPFPHNNCRRRWGRYFWELSEVLTSYFYFYIRFRTTTAVVDGGGIFGIWRVSEEIWVRFFWAKGLGGS